MSTNKEVFGRRGLFVRLLGRARPSYALYAAGLLTLAFCLIACGGGSSGGLTPTPPTPTPPSSSGKELNGTVENWIGQAATLRAELANTVADSAVLAEAPIGADGSFSLSLPGGEGVADHLGPMQGTSCEDGGTGMVEVTPSTLEVASVSYRAYDSTDGNASLLGEVFQAVRSEASSTIVYQIYAASSGTIKGSCVYTYEDENGAGTTYTDTYDMNLVAGWNSFMFTFTENSSTSSTGDVPATARWEYVEGP
jgi:hypothetical protein